MSNVVLLLSMSVVLVWSKSGESQKCETLKPEEITVSINSQRNQTGHWISQIEMITKATKYDFNSPDISSKVNVKYSTTLCGDDSTANIILTITEPPHRVASDYQHFPGIGFYKFHANAASWIRAREICAEERAHLVLIDSKEELNVILELFKRNPKISGSSHNNTDWAWIGVYEGLIEKQFFTIFGESVNENSFMKWQPGQPDDKTVNRSVGVCAYRLTGNMNDLDDTWRLPFICEQEL